MDKEKLIYDLIFSENNSYEIEVSDYIEDIYKYDHFIDDVKDILKKSKVKIIREKVIINTNSIVWKLKVKK